MPLFEKWKTKRMKKKMIHEIMHVLVVKLSNCFIAINSRGSGKILTQQFKVKWWFSLIHYGWNYIVLSKNHVAFLGCSNTLVRLISLSFWSFCLFSHLLQLLFESVVYKCEAIIFESSDLPQEVLRLPSDSHMVVFKLSSNYQFVIHCGAYGIESFFSFVFLLETDFRFDSETIKLCLEFWLHWNDILRL